MSMEVGLFEVAGILAGIALGAALIAGFRIAGFDQDRATWPLVLMAIAVAYVLLAAGAGSRFFMGVEALIAVPFIALAVYGYHQHQRIVLAGALLGHALIDLLHVGLIDHAGVPALYPWLCVGTDVTLAGWILLARRSES